MLLNQQARDLVDAFVVDAKYAQAAVKAMNATVLLRGSGKLGFIGSAVILGAGKEVSYDKTKGKWSTTGTKFTVVVSALHNLSVNGDKEKKIPPLNGNNITWNQDYADKFAQEVKIVYGADRADVHWGSKPQAVAAINHVLPIFQSNVGATGKMITIDADHSSDSAFQLVNLKGKTTADGGSPSGANQDGITPVVGKEADSWSYDVVLLLSKDVNLYTYATAPGKCDYMAGVDLKSLSEKVVNAWSEGARNYMTPVMRRDYRLLQTGYGDTSDPKVPVKIGKGMTKRPETSAGAQYQTFQYKRSEPKVRATASNCYLNTEYQLPNKSELVITYSGGLELRCFDGNSSTYAGDSGGPLLAFPIAGGPVAYLVGVTLGAGMATSLESATGKSVWEYDNNFATSLGYFYKNLYDLRFQNV